MKTPPILKFFNPQEMLPISDQEALDGLVGIVRTLQSGCNSGNGLTKRETCQGYAQAWQGLRLIADLLKENAALTKENEELSMKIAQLERICANGSLHYHASLKSTEPQFVMADEDLPRCIDEAGMTEEVVFGRSRLRETVLARTAFACALNNHLGMHPTTICRLLGRDRTTILHFFEMHERRLNTDPMYAAYYRSSSEAVIKFRRKV